MIVFGLGGLAVHIIEVVGGGSGGSVRFSALDRMVDTVTVLVAGLGDGRSKEQVRIINNARGRRRR